MPVTAVQPHHGSHSVPSLEQAIVVDAARPALLPRNPQPSLAEFTRMMAPDNHCHLVVEDPDGQRIAILSTPDIAGLRAWDDD